MPQFAGQPRAQRDPGQRLADDAVGDQRRVSAEPTAVGITSTTSAPTRSSSARDQSDARAAGRSAVSPPGSGVPVPPGGRPGPARRRRRSGTPGRPRRRRPRGATTSRMPRSRTSWAKRHVIAALGLPAELGLARPVAAQADLGVAAPVDVAVVDQLLHEGAVRAPDAEDLRAGVGVGVEVDDADRAVDGRARRARRAW